MPADKPNIGMEPRRQGDTEPDRTDDSNRSVERAIDEERQGHSEESYERGKAIGAHGNDTPHQPIKPGTRIDLDDAGLGGS